MSSKPDMKTQATDFAKARWDDFKAFTPGQKAVTIVAVAALAIGGYLLATWKTDPAYSPLYSNLAATDASSIVGKLQSENIPYKLTDGGAGISVPTDKVDQARIDVSAAGLPNSGNSGYDLLDKVGVTTSQFMQQVDYQRAVEGELAKTIQSISGIESAQVHLAIPTDDVYSDDSSKPTAAVMLVTTPGETPTSSQVKSIVYLVSSSVPGMKSSGVTVTDSDGDVLSAAGSGTAGGIGGTQAEATAAYDNQIKQQIEQMLTPYVGAGHAQVVVNAALDYSTSKTDLKKYVYDAKNPPISQSVDDEKYTGTGTGSTTGGTLGTGADTTATSGRSGNYDHKVTTTNNALGTLEQVTSTPPGSVQKLNVAVMLDKSVKGLDVPTIENLIKSGVGYTPSRGDNVAVDAVTFDNSATTAAAAAAKQAAAAAAAAKSHAQLVSEIKQGAFAALILALVLGTWLAARKRRGGTPARPDTDPDLVDDLLGSPHTLDTTERFEPVKSHVPPVNPRRDDVLDAVDRAPADVAQVLSGWLSTKDR